MKKEDCIALKCKWLIVVSLRKQAVLNHSPFKQKSKLFKYYQMKYNDIHIPILDIKAWFSYPKIGALYVFIIKNHQRTCKPLLIRVNKHSHSCNCFMMTFLARPISRPQVTALRNQRFSSFICWIQTIAPEGSLLYDRSILYR